VSDLGDTTVRLCGGSDGSGPRGGVAVGTRWERPGRSAQLRVRITPPPLLGWGGDLAQVTPLAYPVLVIVAPGWGYDGWLNWSSRIDLSLQAVGAVIWAVGLVVVIWAASTLGRHLAVDGLAVDHELVVHGPYRHVRHPVYGSFTAHRGGHCPHLPQLPAGGSRGHVGGERRRWWAAAEEELLTSPEGFGDAYRRYADRTGRFLSVG
jgi:protein-S-isoprenylcysteine O-methyltransferase Ste14